MPNQLRRSSAFNESNGFQQIYSVYREWEEEKKPFPGFLPNTKHVRQPQREADPFLVHALQGSKL